MKEKTVGKRLMSVEETAEYLGLARQTLYNRIAPKAKNPFPIRPKRIGGKPLFDRQEVDRYIDGL